MRWMKLRCLLPQFAFRACARSLPAERCQVPVKDQDREMIIAIIMIISIIIFCGQHHKYFNLSDVVTSLQTENVEEVVEDTLHHSWPGFHNFFSSFSNIFCLFSVLNYLHSLPGLIKIPQTRCVKNIAMDTYQEILDHWIMCRSSYEAKGRSVLEKIGEFDSPFSLSFSLLLSSLIFT